MFSGVALLLLQGRAVSFRSPAFEQLAIGQLIPGLPNIALCALIAWAITVFIAASTRFGRYMYLIGGGELVAKTAGVPVRRYKIYAFILSGVLAGIGASLAVARLGAAGPTLGGDLLLNSLAGAPAGRTEPLSGF